MNDETTTEPTPVVEPVLTQIELDLIIEQLTAMNENLNFINKKIEGEFDAEGNLLATPAEETEFFVQQTKLEEIHTETVAQTAILSELYTSEINQEPYRYDIAEASNGHLLNLTEQIEIMNTSIQENADINYLSQASIITYSTVFLPLFAIIAMLWWFFKNFLNRIR